MKGWSLNLGLTCMPEHYPSLLLDLSLYHTKALLNKYFQLFPVIVDLKELLRVRRGIMCSDLVLSIK